jgi:hypothetical protein
MTRGDIGVVAIGRDEASDRASEISAIDHK